MGDFKINTSAIERSNLTNRSMNAYQVRKSAAFAKYLTATFYHSAKSSRILEFRVRHVFHTRIARLNFDDKTVKIKLDVLRSLESRHSLAWWVTTVLNFSRVSRVLRVKFEQAVGRRLYQQRTPAMAAGIAGHVWSTLELLHFAIPKMGS